MTRTHARIIPSYIETLGRFGRCSTPNHRADLVFFLVSGQLPRPSAGRWASVAACFFESPEASSATEAQRLKGVGGARTAAGPGHVHAGFGSLQSLLPPSQRCSMRNPHARPLVVVGSRRAHRVADKGNTHKERIIFKRSMYQPVLRHLHSGPGWRDKQAGRPWACCAALADWWLAATSEAMVAGAACGGGATDLEVASRTVATATCPPRLPGLAFDRKPRLSSVPINTLPSPPQRARVAEPPDPRPGTVSVVRLPRSASPQPAAATWTKPRPLRYSGHDLLMGSWTHRPPYYHPGGSIGDRAHLSPRISRQPQIT